MTWVELESLSFECIVGILASEQVRTQPVVVDLSMKVDWLKTAQTGALDGSVNYAAVAEQVQFIAQHGRWRLLESICTASARLLLLAPAAGEGRAPIHGVRMRIRKPTILDNATPAVRIEADSSLTPGLDSRDGVQVAVLEQTPITGAYRVTIPAGGRWSLPWDNAALVIAGPDAGTAIPRGADRTLGGDEAVTVLVVGRPL